MALDPPDAPDNFPWNRAEDELREFIMREYVDLLWSQTVSDTDFSDEDVFIQSCSSEPKDFCFHFDRIGNQHYLSAVMFEINVDVSSQFPHGQPPRILKPVDEGHSINEGKQHDEQIKNVAVGVTILLDVILVSNDVYDAKENILKDISVREFGDVVYVRQNE